MKIKISWLNKYTKTILRDVGLLLHVPGIMALISLPICFIFGEYYAIWPFLLTSLASLSCGQLIYRIFYKASEGAHLRHAMLTVALSWGLIPLFGAIPFLAIGSYLSQFPITPLTITNFQRLSNALFESYSGFTGTGLSVALQPSQLPHSLQWWRSFIQWVGGVGVIVLVLSVLEPSTNAYELYYSEGRSKKIALTVTETVRKIWKIFLFYTALSILLLRLLGMPWWEAINHGMTGISTGGLAVTDDSIGAYSPVVRLAVIAIMIMGGISFYTHYNFLKQRRLSALWEDAQHRALWLLIGLGTVVLLIENFWLKGEFIWVDTLFQWVSALSTCGFSSVTIQELSSNTKLLLTLGMIFGGAAGSTVGGIKLKRVVWLYKALLWHFQRISLKPHQLMRYQLNNEPLNESEAYRQIQAAAVLVILWISLIFISVQALFYIVLPEYKLSDVIFEAASALGNAGLSTGISHPDLHWLGKLILILLMWMGRLEIIPVMILFSSLIGGLKRIINSNFKIQSSK